MKCYVIPNLKKSMFSHYIIYIILLLIILYYLINKININIYNNL